MSTTDGLTSRVLKTIDKADLTALLGAFCFFLSAIEYMMPKPLPFLRLGIANLPLLLAVDLLPLSWFLVLALVKVIGMSLISGSLFSFVALFSLAGTFAAALTMRAAKRLGGGSISAIGVSVLGATASNAAQVVLAMALVFGEAAKLIAPVFLGMGLATGLLLGMLVEGFTKSSSWLSQIKGLGPGFVRSGRVGTSEDEVGISASVEASENASPMRDTPGLNQGQNSRRRARAAKRAERRAATAERLKHRRRRFEGLFNPTYLVAAGMAVSIAFLFQRQIGIRALMCLAFFILSSVSGRGFSPFATILTMAGITVANLLVPAGRVIATLGSFPITTGALADGFSKALVFEGLIFISRISILPTLRLPGRLGSIVAKAFRYYHRILERKADIRPATLLRDVDALVLRIWEDGGEGSEPMADRASQQRPFNPGRFAAYAALAMATAAAYMPLVFK